MGVKLGSSGGRRTRRGKAMMAEINVTPFVDVMLVLLVIFMITAPLMTAGVPVNLPKAQAKAISQEDNKPIEISLDNKGGVFLGESKMTMDQLKAKIAAIAVESTEQRIYIRADDGLDYGRVMEVMAAVNTAGFTKIALVTDPVTAKKD
jgi:biopolymer transport protein TolR